MIIFGKGQIIETVQSDISVTMKIQAVTNSYCELVLCEMGVSQKPLCQLTVLSRCLQLSIYSS